MEFLKDVLSSILSLGGIFTLFYIGGYVIEFGRLKARRKLQACDVCFGRLKRINKDMENQD